MHDTCRWQGIWLTSCPLWLNDNLVPTWVPVWQVITVSLLYTNSIHLSTGIMHDTEKHTTQKSECQHRWQSDFVLYIFQSRVRQQTQYILSYNHREFTKNKASAVTLWSIFNDSLMGFRHKNSFARRRMYQSYRKWTANCMYCTHI